MYKTNNRFAVSQEQGDEVSQDASVRIIDAINSWFGINLYDFKDLTLVEQMNRFIKHLSTTGETGQKWSIALMTSWGTAMRTVTKEVSIVSYYPV